MPCVTSSHARRPLRRRSHLRRGTGGRPVRAGSGAPVRPWRLDHPGRPDRGRRVHLPSGGSSTGSSADAPSGPVTYSGEYRCLPSSAEGRPVQVSPALEDAHQSIGLSGSPAVCDGAVHPWSTTTDSAPTGDLRPVVHLYRLDPANLGWLTVPVPTELAHAG
ncbi:DUF6299 family protein [Streptacidiphilus monticola]